MNMNQYKENCLYPNTEQRKSYMALGEIYFWTATINHWNRLLLGNEFKAVIVNSLCHLSRSGNIDVFAFVIMPNHIHLIWRINQLNGKETPQGSLLKFTAHTFKKMLQATAPVELTKYAVMANNKRYEFWQRDSLAIHLYTRAVAMQKLHYLHNNPIAPHWQLSATPADYAYSSAHYYEGQEKQFDFLKDLRDEFF
jgi:putative transposase